MDVDLLVFDVDVVYAGTWHASKRFDPESDVAETYGTRFARMQEHRRSLIHLLENYVPHVVAIETPFMSRFPQAFGALSELFAILQTTVYEFSPDVGFMGVDNRSAKTAVGIKTKKVDKTDVREAVLNLININTPTGVDLTKCDEHSIDAIAVGYYATECLTYELKALEQAKAGK